jgi:hypothetical protein
MIYQNTDGAISPKYPHLTHYKFFHIYKGAFERKSGS